MIKFSQKNVEKSDILNLIDDELISIEVHLTFQRKLNEQILSYLKSFMNENSFSNDSENIDSLSDYLNNTSKVLKKSANNLSKFQALQSKLFSIKKTISELEQPSSNFVKTQIDDYNKKYTEILEKTSSVTSEIQTFLAQCEQDDILKELLIEKENSKKSNEFVNKITDTQILPVPTSLNKNNLEEKILDNDNTTISENDITENIYPEIIVPIIDSEKESLNKNQNDSDTLLYTDLTETSNVTIVESSIEEVQTTASENTDINTNQEVPLIEETLGEQNNIISEISDASNTINSTSDTPESVILTDSTELTNNNNAENISSSLNEGKNIQPLIENSNIIENTLIISEKNGNVILPYTMEELNSALKKNPYKYENIEDVIQKKYTKPIKYYKNSSIARFKETFKLVREREKGSLKHAWDLALEAFFNYDLHPAIISACKSIDELDIYLSCLEYDELEDFRFFKIIFDVLPTLSKKKKILV